jgi:transposase
MMSKLKKGTTRYRMVRDCLIVDLAYEKDLKLPNVAEEAGVHVRTVKNVLKKFDQNGGKIADVKKLKAEMFEEKKWQYHINCLLSKGDPAMNIKEIQMHLRIHCRTILCHNRIKSFLIENGYRWRTLRAI